MVFKKYMMKKVFLISTLLTVGVIINGIYRGEFTKLDFLLLAFFMLVNSILIYLKNLNLIVLAK